MMGGETDNGEGNLEPRGEGERYRQMEGKSKIVTWVGQRQKMSGHVIHGG